MAVSRRDVGGAERLQGLERCMTAHVFVDICVSFEVHCFVLTVDRKRRSEAIEQSQTVTDRPCEDVDAE